MHRSSDTVPITNLGLVERWTSMIGGGLLVAYGLKKRSLGGAALATLGGDLMYRGATGYCHIYQALGVHPNTEGLGESTSIPYELGTRIDRAVTISKPRDQVYSFWRNFENLPRFTKYLKGVTVTGPTTSHWIACGPGGRNVEWDAEINSEVENERIGWRSLEGSEVDIAGSVRFEDAPGGRGTEVHVSLQYNPPGGFLGAAAAKLAGADPAFLVEDSLRRLKQVLEAGDVASTAGQPQGSMFPEQEARPRRKPARKADEVEVASEDSFPASDAPSWGSVKVG